MNHLRQRVITVVMKKIWLFSFFICGVFFVLLIKSINRIPGVSLFPLHFVSHYKQCNQIVLTFHRFDYF